MASANFLKLLTKRMGKPAFRDEHLPRFSISYAGNIVGVALSTPKVIAADMELPHATRSLHASPDADRYVFNSNERVWIANQHDPDEARAQLDALHQKRHETDR